MPRKFPHPPPWSRPLLAALLVLVPILLLFRLLHQPLAEAWFTFGLHPQVLLQLESSLEDLKTLARLDPEAADRYRQRFEGTATLVQHLQVLEHSRDSLVERYELLLFTTFGAGALALTLLTSYRRKRREERLERLQHALSALAAGDTDLALGETRRDTLGRIALMIERTSKRMARDQKRLRALQNLSAWQEAARRHAHEMRTPLTGARLELSRLESGAHDPEIDLRDAVRRAAHSIEQELDRLTRFTEQFTSFARLPRPRFEVLDPQPLIAEFVDTFAAAWPRLELIFEAEQSAEIAVDADMLRQVLVNLCDNAALALESAGEERGPLRLRLDRQGERLLVDVRDRGPGIAPEIRDRLFEPYTTTRSIGHGMGLGLAICRKILLDHGGDLELLETSPGGTTFRLTFPIHQRRPDGVRAGGEST